MKQWIRASLGLAMLWPALAAIAQNTNSGEIRGVVTDSAGAVIPGATVKVDDVDKGISHTYTTDGAGLYDHWFDRSGSLPDHRYRTWLPDLCSRPDHAAGSHGLCRRADDCRWCATGGGRQDGCASVANRERFTIDHA